ncbi:MAG: hypothetical protein ACFFDW_02025 [Candidatus Thorarchaeota archaeon]
MSQEEMNSQRNTENEVKISIEETEPKKRFSFLQIKLPKWALALLMTIPSAIIVSTIILVDFYVGFPANINPIAIIAIIGISLVGIAVVSDMLFRNYFIYRMIRRENVKSKIYKEIIKERETEKKAKAQFEYSEDEYEYDEEGEEYEEGEETDEEIVESEQESDELEEEEDEYQYDVEEEDESKYYRMKSLLLRGGIFSILFVNGIILLGLAVILQLTYAGGFQVDETT